MKEITKESIIEYLNNHEIALTSTHKTLCLPIIKRIYKKMSAGIKFSAINVKDNMICDGHHRYIASLLADFQLEHNPGVTTSASIPVDWNSIIFDENDWDSESKLEILNKRDADYNNMTMEDIVDLLK